MTVLIYLNNKIWLDFVLVSEINIQTERVDDIPLLIQQQREMGIAQIIDAVIPRHGNRQGLSVGWTTVGWLTYITVIANLRSLENAKGPRATPEL